MYVTRYHHLRKRVNVALYICVNIHLIGEAFAIVSVCLRVCVCMLFVCACVHASVWERKEIATEFPTILNRARITETSCLRKTIILARCLLRMKVLDCYILLKRNIYIYNYDT